MVNFLVLGGNSYEDLTTSLAIKLIQQKAETSTVIYYNQYMAQAGSFEKFMDEAKGIVDTVDDSIYGYDTPELCGFSEREIQEFIDNKQITNSPLKNAILNFRQAASNFERLGMTLKHLEKTSSIRFKPNEEGGKSGQSLIGESTEEMYQAIQNMIPANSPENTLVIVQCKAEMVAPLVDKLHRENNNVLGYKLYEEPDSIKQPHEPSSDKVVTHIRCTANKPKKLDTFISNRAEEAMEWLETSTSLSDSYYHVPEAEAVASVSQAGNSVSSWWNPFNRGTKVPSANEQTSKSTSSVSTSVIDSVPQPANAGTSGQDLTTSLVEDLDSTPATSLAASTSAPLTTPVAASKPSRCSTALGVLLWAPKTFAGKVTSLAANCSRSKVPLASDEKEASQQSSALRRLLCCCTSKRASVTKEAEPVALAASSVSDAAPQQSSALKRLLCCASKRASATDEPVALATSDIAPPKSSVSRWRPCCASKKASAITEEKEPAVSAASSVSDVVPQQSSALKRLFSCKRSSAIEGNPLASVSAHDSEIRTSPSCMQRTCTSLRNMCCSKEMAYGAVVLGISVAVNYFMSLHLYTSCNANSAGDALLTRVG